MKHGCLEENIDCSLKTSIALWNHFTYILNIFGWILNLEYWMKTYPCHKGSFSHYSLHTTTRSLHTTTWSIHTTTWSHKILPWHQYVIIVLHHTWSYHFSHLYCDEMGSYQVEKVHVMCSQDQNKHKSRSKVCSHWIVVPQNTCKNWPKWSRMVKDHVW